jgi:hypothetical protein
MPPTEFLLTSLVVVLVPGTGVIYTVTTDSKQCSWNNTIKAHYK